MADQAPALVTPAIIASGRANGIRNWNAVEGLDAVEITIELGLQECTSEKDTRWDTVAQRLGQKHQPPRLPSAVRDHVRDMVKDCKSWSSFYSARARDEPSKYPHKEPDVIQLDDFDDPDFIERYSSYAEAIYSFALEISQDKKVMVEQKLEFRSRWWSKESWSRTRLWICKTSMLPRLKSKHHAVVEVGRKFETEQLGKAKAAHEQKRLREERATEEHEKKIALYDYLMSQPYAYATPENRENIVNNSSLGNDLVNRTAALEEGLHKVRDEVAGMHVKLEDIQAENKLMQAKNQLSMAEIISLLKNQISK